VRLQEVESEGYGEIVICVKDGHVVSIKKQVIETIPKD